MLFVKYGKNWLHGFRGDVVWKCWRWTDGHDDWRTTDACLYYKLTYEPSIQVSQKLNLSKWHSFLLPSGIVKFWLTNCAKNQFRHLKIAITHKKIALDSAQSRNLHLSRRKTKPTKWHAPNEDSDQPGHPPRLISLQCPHEETLGP